MKYIVTGSSGFIGAQVAAAARYKGFAVLAPSRRDLSADWLIEPGDIIVHCAGATHAPHRRRRDAEQYFQEANVRLTLALASRAVEAGAKRFIFISSIKAIGESTPVDRPFTTTTLLQPRDAYGRSKKDAELGLAALASSSRLELCVIRPPLVYGPGVKGNFRQLFEWIIKDRPLPFAGLRNRRSLVGLTNLTNLIMLCAKHPNAAGRTFLVSDGTDLSTPELVTRMALIADRKPRLFKAPLGLLERLATVVGRSDAIHRLRCSLRVNMTEVTHQLSWSPPVTIDEELRSTFDSIRHDKTRAPPGYV